MKFMQISSKAKVLTACEDKVSAKSGKTYRSCQIGLDNGMSKTLFVGPYSHYEPGQIIDISIKIIMKENSEEGFDFSCAEKF